MKTKGYNCIPMPKTGARPARPYTDRALELVDEGLISARSLALMALKWMSEEDVKDMLCANELLLEEDAI